MQIPMHSTIKVVVEKKKQSYEQKWLFKVVRK